MFKKSLIGLFCFTLIFIAGCKDESEFKSDEEHFEKTLFTNKYNQNIGVTSENSVRISGYYREGSQSDLNPILKQISNGSSNFVEHYYSEYTLKTKDNKYYLSLNDEIEIVFERIGERIIVDEAGAEYTTPTYLDEE